MLESEIAAYLEHSLYPIFDADELDDKLRLLIIRAYVTAVEKGLASDFEHHAPLFKITSLSDYLGNSLYAEMYPHIALALQSAQGDMTDWRKKFRYLNADDAKELQGYLTKSVKERYRAVFMQPAHETTSNTSYQPTTFVNYTVGLPIGLVFMSKAEQSSTKSILVIHDNDLNFDDTQKSHPQKTLAALAKDNFIDDDVRCYFTNSSSVTDLPHNQSNSELIGSADMILLYVKPSALANIFNTLAVYAESSARVLQAYEFEYARNTCKFNSIIDISRYACELPLVEVEWRRAMEMLAGVLLEAFKRHQATYATSNTIENMCIA